MSQSMSAPTLNDPTSSVNQSKSVVPMQTPKIYGSSQQMSLALGVSTPINNDKSNSTGSGMYNENTESLVNPNEFEAIKAPAWLGGVYAVGGGRSLFNGRKEDKGFKINWKRTMTTTNGTTKFTTLRHSEHSKRIARRRCLKHIDQKRYRSTPNYQQGQNNPGLRRKAVYRYVGGERQSRE